MEAANKKNSQLENRKRISETLKKKWEDPEFREIMMEKIQNRKRTNVKQTEEHKRKLSETMKKKWQDPEYREKTLKGIQSYNDAKPPSTSPPRQRKPATPRVPKKKILSVHEVTPKPKRKRVKKKVTVAKKKAKLEDADSIEAKKATKTAGNGDESEDDRINRMKTENNDLYDLLYGDDNLMVSFRQRFVAYNFCI